MLSVIAGAPSLREIQNAMAARLLPPGAAGASPALCLDEWLYVPNPARVAERLDVYTGGYPARIHEALSDTFPAVARAVGHAAFHDLALRYAESVPLRSYNLNDAGERLPQFLGGEGLAAQAPFLPDLARLEWLVAQAFHAAERPPLDPRALAWSTEDWARAVLQFQPSVALLSSQWPLLALWPEDSQAADAAEIARLPAAQHLVVRRSGYVVRCESIGADEARALALLLAGGDLSGAAEQLDAEGVDPAAISESFSRWITAGMIQAAHIPPP